MANSLTGDVGRRLRHLFGAGSAVGLTDGQLLERFAGRHGESDAEARDAAFEAILDRHGAMVLMVCRQMLVDAHTAEDAFQATFLVLIRRAESLRLREHGSLGPWLHGVAYRIALNARRASARRHTRERRVAVPEAMAGDGAIAVDRDDRNAMLHQEVNRLPDRYRVPVVLCYFEGRTHDEAAAALNWPVGTVRGRLARARDRLRVRLTRRGLAPALALEATLQRFSARAEVSASLRDATLAAAIRGVPAARVTALAKLVSRSWLGARLKMSAAFVLVPALLATGASLAGYGSRAVPPAPQLAPAPEPVDRRPTPLPKYARARLGTPEFLGQGEFNLIAHTSDGKYLASWENTGFFRIWDVASGRTVRKFQNAGDFAIAPDGTTMACFDPANGLRLEDLVSGRERRRWHNILGESYGALTFSPDGRILAAITRKEGDSDFSRNLITLWDTASPTEFRRRVQGDWSGFHGFAFTSGGKELIVLSDDWNPPAGGFPFPMAAPANCYVRIYDIATGRKRKQYLLQGVPGHPFAFSRDGTLLAATGTDQKIRLIEVATGRERGPRLGHDRRLVDADAMDVGSCLAFSADGSILASGSFVGTTAPRAPIHLWDVARGKELRHFPAHPELIRSISFYPDGQTIASGALERVIRIWDVATGRELVPHTGHQSAIWTLAISPADGTIYTSGTDRTVRHWDQGSGRDLGVFARLRLPAFGMAISPDGKNVLVGGYTGVAIWSVAERREVRRLTSHDGGFMSFCCDLAYAPDGKTVIAEGRVWDVSSGESLMALRAHRFAPPLGPLSSGYGAPAGKPLADGQNQAPREKPILDRNPIFYAPDGKQIITTEPEGIRIWDVASRKEICWAVRSRIYDDNNYQHHAALSPDGRFMGICSEATRNGEGKLDPTINLWELASGQEVVTLKSHQETDLQGLAFSPDGRLLASGGGSEDSPTDATVRVWDLRTGRELRRFEGHLAKVNAVAFSPDGRSVISGSADATAMVWDVSDLTGRPIADEPMTAEAIQARWDELASPDARAAYRASWTLSNPSAVPFLREHLRPVAAPEPDALVASPETLRILRAIAALERIATSEARAILERLAKGGLSAIETREARSTLARAARVPDRSR